MSLNKLTRNVIFKRPWKETVPASSEEASKSISDWNAGGTSSENGLHIQTLSAVGLFSLVSTAHQNMLQSVTEI
jgi:hypothetical protein